MVSIPFRYITYISGFMYTLLLFLLLPFYAMYSKPDFIVLESLDPTFWSAIPLLLMPRSVRPRIVLDVRSTPVKDSYAQTLLFRTAVLMARAGFDGITVITPMMKEEIRNTFQVAPRFLGVWTDGASAELFNPASYDGAAMRKRFGLEHKFVILFHGALSLVHRGIHGSIKSLELLREDCPDLVLFLLGDGGDLPKINDTIKKSNIEDRVIVHGRVDYEEVPQYIALCDVGLVLLPDLPIWRHQCPLNLLEYLAMEKVVIATDIPANRQILGESKCGIYVPTTDPSDVADAVAYAYSNRRHLDDWGLRGRLIVNRRYSWDKVAEDFERFLTSLEKNASK